MLSMKKAMFTLTIFEILLFEDITGSERLINVLLVRFLPHPEKHGTPSSNNVLQNRNGT